MRDIAKRLDIRTKDLLKLNPDVGRKPVANTKIIIPNPKNVTKNIDNTKDNTNTVVDTKVEEVDNITSETNKDVKIAQITYEYTTHTVQPKETVYALTKRYNISKSELLKLNPEYPELRNNKLSIGQILKVESKEVKTYVSLEEDLKNYVTHTVKPKETVYGLTRFYNISKDELIRLNPEYPELKDNNLGINQTLRIRTLLEKISIDDTTFYEDIITDNASMKLAILLPFKSKEYNSIASKNIFNENMLTNMVTDFYMGAEIAIDSIKQQGINVDVSVFDTGNRGSNIKNILATNELANVDVVIGPFYSSKAELVANNITSPVIFPHFSKNQSEFSSSRLVKAEPDIDIHTDFLSSYVKEIYKGETIFIVGDGKKTSDTQIKNLVSNLKQHDSINKITVLKPKDGYIKKTRFTNEMKPNSHSLVIMTSNDNAAVADALNSMIVLPENVTAQVFSVNKNKAYDEIDNNKLARIKFAYVTNSFNDENSTETKAFNKKYKRKNFSIPSQYSVKGFDVTYDVLMRLASGEQLLNTFKNGASLRLESKFDYDKKTFGSTSNKGLFIVKYNTDLSLERLK